MEFFSVTQPTSTPSITRAPRRKRGVGVSIGVLVLIVVIGYLFAGGGGDEPSGPSPVQPSSQFTPRANPAPSASVRGGSQVSADDPTWGPRGAAVTVVEFSDFECPFCREAYPLVRVVMQRYGDRVLFQYRDFPISDIHANAQKAAEAAQCAHEQGKFWEYHDRIFQNQEALAREDLTRYALETRLDIAAFNRCLDGGTKAQEVLDDFQEGVNAGVSGTPTFFINGAKYEGVLSEEEFTEILEDLLGN